MSLALEQYIWIKCFSYLQLYMQQVAMYYWYITVLRTAGLGFYSCGSASRMILARSGRETSTGYTNWFNVFCFMSSLPPLPQPPQQCLGPTHISSLHWTNTNHMRGEVSWDPKEKTIVGLLVFIPLWDRTLLSRAKLFRRTVLYKTVYFLSSFVMNVFHVGHPAED
jgi:hypothetical protein